MNTKLLGAGIEAAVRDPSLREATAAMAEIAIDSALKEGVLRDIPVVGTLVGLHRAALSIPDQILLTKLRHMLLEIEEVPVEQRQEVIEQINASEKYMIKVGEKLLYIVEQCEDHQSSALVGKLFKAFLKGALDYPDFLRLTSIVNRTHIDDLMEFATSNWGYCEPEEASSLLGTGLVELNSPDVEVKQRKPTFSYEDNEDTFEVKGDELTVSVTELGNKLRAILGPHANA